VDVNNVANMACIPTTVKETKRDYILNTSKDKLYNRYILYSVYQMWKKENINDRQNG
jgi:hypothetical protein